MNGNRLLLIAGVVATLAAWGCFELMETVEDYSPASTAFFFGGYGLIAVALALFLLGWSKGK